MEKLVKFSISDWVFNGGVFYGPPFISRALLYRIYDRNCSLLVYHEPTVTSTVGSPAEIKSSSTETVFNYHSVVQEPESMYVCHSRSASSTFDELVRMEPLRLHVSKSSKVERPLGDFLLRVEPHRMPVSQMFAIGGTEHDYEIEGTAYRIQSEIPIAPLFATRNADGLFSCWKVVLSEKGESYDLSSRKNWALSAMELDDSLQPSSVMHLERRQSAPKVERR
jgi:hypothetical protein